MTNEELLQDLKQFITATVSAEVRSATADLRTELGGRLDTLGNRVDGLSSEVKQLRTEVQDGFAAAARATGEIHEQLEDHDRRLTDHGRRIQHLERNAA